MMLRPYSIVAVAPSISTTITNHPYLQSSQSWVSLSALQNELQPLVVAPGGFADGCRCWLQACAETRSVCLPGLSST